MSSNKNLLEVKDLSVEYRIEKQVIHALDQASISLPDGGTLGIVGESGSGKTTLGMGIMKLIEPPGRISGGEVNYDGKNVLKFSDKELRRFRWEQVAMIYQSAMNSLNPVKTITHPIAEVLRVHKHLSKPEAYDQAIKLLQDVGISQDRALSYPHEMSGGMRQRVVIALALALSPRLLIADEPTSALDVVTQRQILDLIKRQIAERGLSLIFITHEMSLLNGLVEQIAVMYRGEIVEKGRAWEVLTNPKHPYTEILIASLLTSNSKLRPFEARVNPPGESAAVSGSNYCKFVNRCKYAFDRCRKERPLLKETSGGNLVACHKYT